MDLEVASLVSFLYGRAFLTNAPPSFLNKMRDVFAAHAGQCSNPKPSGDKEQKHQFVEGVFTGGSHKCFELFATKTMCSIIPRSGRNATDRWYSQNVR